MITENQTDNADGKPRVMPTTGMTPATSETDAGDRAGLTCAVCPHPQDSHDRIGLRYCAATAAGALRRGCVCVGDTNHANPH